MRLVMGYALSGLVALTLVCVVVSPWIDPVDRDDVLLMAAVAWTVQVPAFGAMVRFRSRDTRFLAAWGGGMLLRLLVLGLVTAAVWWFPALAPAPTLLALAGFLFGLLLLEGPFLAKAPPREDDDRYEAGVPREGPRTLPRNAHE